MITNSTQETPRTGAWYAKFNGKGARSGSFLDQEVTIPSTANSVTLSFWLKISTDESPYQGFDHLEVSAGSITLAIYTNLDLDGDYELKTFDLSAFRGQTIRISFIGREDSTLQTSFFIDDVSCTWQ